ncbi:PD40 domain-containing protein [Cytophaga aurantiaca]|uniref:PD40 domain-containing protein n=1 Tax=Cytophaga aurantiaca TaxID=29530 RepID=UPI0003610251|nr:PD40 domain-containing protein [Cytophaga aurantiaca]
MFSKKIGSIFILIISIALFSTNVFSQTSLSRVELETNADYTFKSKDYYHALPLFLTLDSLYPNVPKYIFPLGVCYINTTGDQKNALKYLEQCKLKSSQYPPTLHYYLGRAYHLSHRFDDAIVEYELCLSHLYKKKKQYAYIIKDIYREIEMCENGKQLIKDELIIDIQNLGPKINSNYPEYAPVLTLDEKELIFTSCRPETTGGLIDTEDGLYFEDVYISSKKDSSWSTAINMGSSINTIGHDASVSLTPDGQQLLIYRYENEAGFLLSKLDGVTWLPAEELLGEVNSKFYEPSACLTKDGSFLIFSSNRPGGYGGLDLYISKKLVNNEWARPINLGPVINTKYDEDSPFLHSDGRTLYFSSNGHNSMGGFDMFVSKSLSDSTISWDKPVNVGYPLNSAHDDIHFSLSADGRRIYFASIRPEGFGDRDIYMATIEQTKVLDVLVIVGVIQDSISKQPISASIEVVDTGNNSIVGIYHSNKVTGKYIMALPEGGKYRISIQSPNYKVCDDVITTKELSGYQERETNINLCPDIIKE